MYNEERMFLIMHLVVVALSDYSNYSCMTNRARDWLVISRAFGLLRRARAREYYWSIDLR